MSKHARSARRIHERFHEATSADLAEIERIRTDRDLKDEVRSERIEPIRQRIQERHWKVSAELNELVNEARAEFLESLPTAIETRAAVKNPARAVEIRTMAEGMDGPTFLRVAKELAQSRDLAGMAGLRQALHRSEIEDADRNEVAEVLDEANSGAYGPALGNLLGAQREFALVDATVPPDGNGVVRPDPAAALGAIRTALEVPQGFDGELRAVPDEEANQALRSIHHPTHPPGGTPQSEPQTAA